MKNEIKEALIKNKVNVDLLIEQLCATSAVKHKQSPIFDKKEFEKVKSVDEFWERLRGLLTIFNFDLFKHIVEISGCRAAQDILKDFLPRFDPSAIEDLDAFCMLENKPWEELPMRVLKAIMPTDKFTLKLVKFAKEKMSEAYQLNEYALYFFKAEWGSVVLHYYTPQSLLSYKKPEGDKETSYVYDTASCSDKMLIRYDNTIIN